jgi:sedoheptulose-bisphosphatase
MSRAHQRGPGLVNGLTAVHQVAHGHILRAFVKRWLLKPMDEPLSLMMSPGAVGVLRLVLIRSTRPGFLSDHEATLSYNHHRIEEPAIMVGMSLPLHE